MVRREARRSFADLSIRILFSLVDLVLGLVVIPHDGGHVEHGDGRPCAGGGGRGGAPAAARPESEPEHPAEAREIQAAAQPDQRRQFERISRFTPAPPLFESELARVPVPIRVPAATRPASASPRYMA